MATFSPFMQSSEAQNIISNYLGGNYAASPNVNTAGVYRNPIFDLRTEQEKAGTLDPSALYPNPQIDFSVADVPVDPCPPGYQLIDGVCQPIEQFGQSLYQPDNQGNNDYVDTRTESQKMYDEMKKDTSIPFGAKKFLEKYQIGEDEDGNPIYDFDEKKGRPFGLFGFADMLFGGGKSREEKYNQAVKTLIDQTQSDFYDNNPFAFGKQSGDLFTMYSPQNYLNQVGDVVVGGSTDPAKTIKGSTVNELLGSVGQGTLGTQQVNTGRQGTEVSRNLGSLLQDDKKRDDTSYQAAIAKNIARNLADRDSTTGAKKSTASTGSKFSKSLGGFYGGR
tara:strand:- start:77 stop:1078 length:1002 start_codon:yes stop_codon:yes gene_type:complete